MDFSFNVDLGFFLSVLDWIFFFIILDFYAGRDFGAGLFSAGGGGSYGFILILVLLVIVVFGDDLFSY